MGTGFFSLSREEKIALERTLKEDNAHHFLRVFSDIQNNGKSRAACIYASKFEPSKGIQRDVLRFWINYGVEIRNDVNDDLVVIGFLRKMLPPYEGPGLKVFRGDSLFNRKRRTYGLSWSQSEQIAREFATGIYQEFVGGSVLLETFAPPDAILLALTGDSDLYGEQEVIIDRRRLKEVKVVEILL